MENDGVFFAMKRTQTFVFAIQLYAKRRYCVGNLDLVFDLFEDVRHIIPPSSSRSSSSFFRFQIWGDDIRRPTRFFLLFVERGHPDSHCSDLFGERRDARKLRVIERSVGHKDCLRIVDAAAVLRFLK